MDRMEDRERYRVLSIPVTPCKTMQRSWRLLIKWSQWDHNRNMAADADTTRCTDSISPCVNGTAKQSPLKRWASGPYTRSCKRGHIREHVKPSLVRAYQSEQKAKLTGTRRDPSADQYTHVDTVTTNRYFTVTSHDIHISPITNSFPSCSPRGLAIWCFSIFPGVRTFSLSNFYRFAPLCSYVTQSTLGTSSILLQRVFHYRCQPVVSRPLLSFTEFHPYSRILPYHTRPHLIALEKFNFGDTDD